MNLKRKTYLLLCVLMLSVAVPAQKSTTPTEVLSIINKANSYWQALHPKSTSVAWDEVVYHIGNLAAYNITRDTAFLKYTENWAVHNHWKGAKSDDVSKWKYTYGETDDYVLFGDMQVCFQVYCDLYTLVPDKRKILRARQVMEYQMSTPSNDYWWWVDGLYMVMPVMTKLYKLTNNPRYLDKLYDYFIYADSLMFDPRENLYYRDARYVYPKHKTASGKKDFWSRGNGWVFAGLAQIINDLPSDYQHKPLFVKRFKQLAQSLVKSQQQGGYWVRSLIDPQQAEGYETSGTAFFTFGLLWGINNGYLQGEPYTTSALKGWSYLSKTALQPSGRIGYVQPIGDKAIAGQLLNEHSTANFGVGAFLMAACEMYKYIR